MTRRLGPWRLTGVAAPMAVWALHLVVVYGLVGLACAEGWPARRIAGLPLLTWVMLAVTAAALALIAWLGRRAWRALPTASDAAPAAAPARRRFTSRATAVLAVVAFIAVAFTAAPMFSLPPCL